MEERVPDWFENLDDDELERRERESRGPRFWVTLVVALIVLGMAVVPTLQMLDLGRGGSDRPAPRLSPARQLAWDFGIAVLQVRSVEDAMRFTAPDQQPAVAAIVDELRTLDQASLAGAMVGVGVVRCVDPAPAGAECFIAWLYQTGRPEIARVGYVVAGQPGSPLVIHVERVEPPVAVR